MLGLFLEGDTPFYIWGPLWDHHRKPLLELGYSTEHFFKETSSSMWAIQDEGSSCLPKPGNFQPLANAKVKLSPRVPDRW